MALPKPSSLQIHRRDLHRSGLVAAWLFGPVRARSSKWLFHDVAGNNTLSFARSNADTKYIDGQLGPVFQSGADGGPNIIVSDYTLSQLPRDVRSRSFSVIGRYRKFGSNPNLESFPGSGTGSAIFSTRNASGNTNGVYLGTKATQALFACDGSGQLVGAEWATTINSNQWYTLAGTFEKTGAATYGGVWTLYVDGVLRGQNNLATAGSFSGALFDGFIRVSGNIQTNHSDKQLDYLYLYDRSLTAAEVRQITEDPFAVFYRRRQVAYFDVGAAAFQSAWARGANVLIGAGLP